MSPHPGRRNENQKSWESETPAQATGAARSSAHSRFLAAFRGQQATDGAAGQGVAGRAATLQGLTNPSPRRGWARRPARTLWWPACLLPAQNVRVRAAQGRWAGY